MQIIQPKIRLALTDDHKLFRRGIISLIEMYYNDVYSVTIEAENGDDLINKLKVSDTPDIVMMDIEMPGRNGYQTVSWMKQHYPDIRILVISQVESEDAIIRMLRSGVKGFLSKDIEPAELHSALQAIHQKGYYYTDFITGKLIHSLQQEAKELDEKEKKNEQIREAVSSLNNRELEFLKLSCSELTYEEIAKRMFLSPKTVDGYRSKLFEKLGVGTRVGLVLYAVKNGIITC